MRDYGKNRKVITGKDLINIVPDYKDFRQNFKFFLESTLGNDFLSKDFYIVGEGTGFGLGFHAINRAISYTNDMKGSIFIKKENDFFNCITSPKASLKRQYERTIHS